MRVEGTEENSICQPQTDHLIDICIHIYAHMYTHAIYVHSNMHTYNHTHHASKKCYVNIKIFMFSEMRQIFWLCRPEISPDLC